MSSCTVCERELAPQARFCGTCGAPADPFSPAAPERVAASPSRKIMTPLVTGVSVAAVIATGAVVFAISQSKETVPPEAGQPAAPGVATTQEWTPPTTAGYTPTWSSPASATVSGPITEDDLRSQIAQDHAAAERLVGNWVPQLSSKSVGLVVHGVTYDHPAVMADFRRLQSSYPDAVMIDSGDYRTYSRPGFFVTLKAEIFGSPDQANAWCAQQGFAPEDCHASRLTHTGGPAGNSRPR
jgi:serine/threonine-protein kinase